MIRNNLQSAAYNFCQKPALLIFLPAPFWKNAYKKNKIERTTICTWWKINRKFPSSYSIWKILIGSEWLLHVILCHLLYYSFWPPKTCQNYYYCRYFLRYFFNAVLVVVVDIDYIRIYLFDHATFVVAIQQKILLSFSDWPKLSLRIFYCEQCWLFFFALWWTFSNKGLSKTPKNNIYHFFPWKTSVTMTKKPFKTCTKRTNSLLLFFPWWIPFLNERIHMYLWSCQKEQLSRILHDRVLLGWGEVATWVVVVAVRKLSWKNKHD